MRQSTRPPVRTILRTPQGIVLLLALLAYISCALLFGLSFVTPPFGWEIGKGIGIFLAWPTLLIVLFIKQNQPAFAASMPAAYRLAFYAVTPFLFMLLGALASEE